jgi:hypothetical protein
MTSNNTIEDAEGAAYGFYNDLVEMLKSELVGEINAGHYEIMGQYSEIFEELTKLENYGGIIKISENNGMGWTATKYQYNEN